MTKETLENKESINTIILSDIEYFNTGCFTDIPSSYIIITDNGEIINKTSS